MFQEVHGVHTGHAGTLWEQTKHWWPFLFSRGAVWTRMLGQKCHLACTDSPEPAPGSSSACGALHNPKCTCCLAKSWVNFPLLLPKRKLFQEQLTLFTPQADINTGDKIKSKINPIPEHHLHRKTEVKSIEWLFLEKEGGEKCNLNRITSACCYTEETQLAKTEQAGALQDFFDLQPTICTSKPHGIYKTRNCLLWLKTDRCRSKIYAFPKWICAFQEGKKSSDLFGTFYPV